MAAAAGRSVVNTSFSSSFKLAIYSHTDFCAGGRRSMAVAYSHKKSRALILADPGPKSGITPIRP
ncbi:MAG: hypothetical protein WCT14_21855, partial [Treponemataceae bacterium]